MVFSAGKGLGVFKEHLAQLEECSPVASLTNDPIFPVTQELLCVNKKRENSVGLGACVLVRVFFNNKRLLDYFRSV